MAREISRTRQDVAHLMSGGGETLGSLVRFEAESVYLLGDVHGRFDRVARVLAHAGLRSGVPAGAALVQVGDLVDRGREDERLPERLASISCLDEGFTVPPPTEDGTPVPLSAVQRGTVPWDKSILRTERVALAGAFDTLATIRGFMTLERQSAGSVHCLLGNHDLDLLRGRFNYFRRQKIYLLALLGLAPDRVRRHAEIGLPPRELADAAPELAWLARRPVLALGAGILAVHGGPTRTLIDQLAMLGIATIDQLGAWLDEIRITPDHVDFREGRSIVSPDQPEDDFVSDAALRGAFLRLAQAEILAVGHSAFLHAGHAERPAILAGGQVIKLDTGMKRGGPAWLVKRQAACWSAIGETGERLELAEASDGARWSATAEEIETRLYAVHGTNHLPTDNFLRAGSANVRRCFRPGTHFSLGSLSDGMDTDSYYRFAVVMPLRELVPQLLNVSPMDTFAIGDVPLSKDTLLIVPDETDLLHLAGSIPVRRYSIDYGLRHTVQDEIEARRGWSVVLPDGFDISQPARVERLDINSSRFFADFLRVHPHVAFGGHAASEVGNAAIFGMIDRLIQGLARQHSEGLDLEGLVLEGLAPGSGRRRTGFVVAILKDFLQRIDRMLDQAGFAPEHLAVCDETLREARSWLAAVEEKMHIGRKLDCRFAASCIPWHVPAKWNPVRRQGHASTLESAAFPVEMGSRSEPGSPSEPISTDNAVASKVGELPEQGAAAVDPAFEYLFAAEVLSVIPRDEVEQLIAVNPDLLEGLPVAPLCLIYATLRWLNIRTWRARREDLDSMIADALSTIELSDIAPFNSFLGHVAWALRPGSNRRDDAWALLALPPVQARRAKDSPALPKLDREELTLRFKNLGR